MNRHLFAVLCTLALASSTSAWAQDSEPAADWTLSRDPETQMVLANIEFDNGLGLIARCRDGVYDLIAAGLPPVPARTRRREISVIVGEGDEESRRNEIWTVGDRPDVAFSRAPAIIARLLAKGGKLQIVIPAVGDGPRTRYVMEAPPSDAALEQTLVTCNRPLYDLRDDLVEKEDGDGPAAGLVRTRRPRADFPDPVRGRMPAEAYAVISCRTEDDGRVSECQAESEQPAGFNVAREALEGTRNARIALSPEAREAGLRLGGRMIMFSVNFRLAD